MSSQQHKLNNALVAQNMHCTMGAETDYSKEFFILLWQNDPIHSCSPSTVAVTLISQPYFISSWMSVAQWPLSKAPRSSSQRVFGHNEPLWAIDDQHIIGWKTAVNIFKRHASQITYGFGVLIIFGVKVSEKFRVGDSFHKSIHGSQAECKIINIMQAI